MTEEWAALLNDLGIAWFQFEDRIIFNDLHELLYTDHHTIVQRSQNINEHPSYSKRVAKFTIKAK